MRILIIDDEARSRQTLQTLINDYCNGVTICGTAGNIDEAQEQIQVHKPDLVFLDISMPGGTGFDLLKQLPAITFEIIFVTAYDEYGIEAIKANALDYLLKPVSIEELVTAVEKARNRMGEKQVADKIAALVKQMDEKGESGKKIAIPSGTGLEFVSPGEIMYLEADGSYTRIVTAGGRKLMSTRHLKEYELLLPAASFIRVHHSHIININHVTHYHRGEGGHVVMADKAEIMVSKRKKKEFLGRFAG